MLDPGHGGLCTLVVQSVLGQRAPRLFHLLLDLFGFDLLQVPMQLQLLLWLQLVVCEAQPDLHLYVLVLLLLKVHVLGELGLGAVCPVEVVELGVQLVVGAWIELLEQLRGVMGVSFGVARRDFEVTR